MDFPLFLPYAEPRAGGWLPAALTFLVHLAFFVLLQVGLHWTRALPPADDGVMWVVPADMPVQEAKPDTEDAALDVPPTKAADVSLGSSGIQNAADNGAKPASASPAKPHPKSALAVSG